MARAPEKARRPLLDEEFLARLERLTLVSRSTVLGRMRGERRSKKRGHSTEFADYRDYVPGDDLRYLDWNIFGRLERLFIKLFHEEEDLTVSILVDASASMAMEPAPRPGGTGECPTKLRYACQVAAALGYIALSAEDRVAVYPFDSDLRAPFRPVRGKRNARRLFHFLDELSQGPSSEDPPETDLAQSVTSFARAHSRRGMVILISDLLDPQGFDEALRSVAGSRQESFLIHLLAPEEIEPTLVGDLRLVDCENGATAEISISRNLLQAYRKTVEGFREAIKEGCNRRGISPLFASTSTPFEHLILGYLRSRGVVA